jgi:hypothetical protein
VRWLAESWGKHWADAPARVQEDFGVRAAVRADVTRSEARDPLAE